LRLVEDPTALKADTWLSSRMTTAEERSTEQELVALEGTLHDASLFIGSLK
jgi:hypothetical protein